MLMQCTFRSSADNSVTQSSFADPCVYLTTSSGNPAGFDSGLQNGKMFSVKITNDQLRKHIIDFVLLFLVNQSTRQPSISSPRRRHFVAKEWSGKWALSSFALVSSLFYRRTFSTRPSGINVPATGNTYNAYLDAAKALGSNEKPVC
jgi:hypothetical protein